LLKLLTKQLEADREVFERMATHAAPGGNDDGDYLNAIIKGHALDKSDEIGYHAQEGRLPSPRSRLRPCAMRCCTPTRRSS
jgi:hypothetical protein